MAHSQPTKEEYDTLLYNLATLESELGQARKLLEAPAKAGWWRRLRGNGSMAVMVALVMVMVAVMLLTVNLCPGISANDDVRAGMKFGLKGLSVVCVSVHYDGDERHKLLADLVQIQTDIEIRLRRAGIKVISQKEFNERNDSECLWVHVMMGEKFASVIFSLHKICVPKNDGYLATWHRDRMIIGEVDQRSLRDGVIDLVDQFINDYLSVNQK